MCISLLPLWLKIWKDNLGIINKLWQHDTTFLFTCRNKKSSDEPLQIHDNGKDIYFPPLWLETPSNPFGFRHERIGLGIINKWWQGHFPLSFMAWGVKRSIWGSKTNIGKVTSLLNLHFKCDNSNGNHTKMEGFLKYWKYSLKHIIWPKKNWSNLLCSSCQ
jgi:hypothetical protein